MLVAGTLARQIPGNPELDTRLGKREPGRHDADHSKCLTLERHRGADDTGVATKALLPQPVTEDDDGIGAGRRSRAVEVCGPRLRLCEGPSQQRGHARERKEIGTHLRGQHDIDSTPGVQRAPDRVVAGDALEGLRPTAPVVDVAAGDTGPIDPKLEVHVSNADELIGSRIRERAEHDTVNQREQHGADRNTHVDGHH